MNSKPKTICIQLPEQKCEPMRAPEPSKCKAWSGRRFQGKSYRQSLTLLVQLRGGANVMMATPDPEAYIKRFKAETGEDIVLTPEIESPGSEMSIYEISLKPKTS